MTSPRVSVGLPVFNGEKYLAQAIESILDQTYPDFELIISDNGSTDTTGAICEGYAARDPRIKYHRSSANRGATWNFNRVVELASGELFRWAAHDDLLEPDCLRSCVDLLDRDDSAVLAHTQVEIIDENGTSQGVFSDDDALALHDPDPSRRFGEVLRDHRCFEVFGLIRLEVLRRVGEMGDYGHADGILLSRLCLRGPFVKISEPLFAERMHSGQSMSVFNCYAEEQGGHGGPADFHSYAAWYNPANEGRLVYPYWRMLREHVRTLRTAETLTVSERVRCSRWVLNWIRHKRYYLRQDLKIAIQHASTRVRRRIGRQPDKASAKAP